MLATEEESKSDYTTITDCNEAERWHWCLCVQGGRHQCQHLLGEAAALHGTPS